MRDIPFETDNEGIKDKIIQMYSIMQIGATIFMLGNINSAFSPLLAIQTTAFFMTLVRKSIITTNMWHYLYTTSLLLNYLLFPTFSPSFLVYSIFVITVHNKIVFPNKINKYLAWGFHFGIFIIIREYGFENSINYYFWKRYYLLWILLKLWIIGKSVYIINYLEQFLDNGNGDNDDDDNQDKNKNKDKNK